uniref:Uncharacterized protein MANES_02G098800 n=1 Tax=Rhizophora mucronata TaxID=61149 RepID=A0A2P2LDT4_RHIMU
MKCPRWAMEGHVLLATHYCCNDPDKAFFTTEITWREEITNLCFFVFVAVLLVLDFISSCIFFVLPTLKCKLCLTFMSGSLIEP